jgi:hypothetical protein
MLEIVLSGAIRALTWRSLTWVENSDDRSGLSSEGSLVVLKNKTRFLEPVCHDLRCRCARRTKDCLVSLASVSDAVIGAREGSRIQNT